MHPQLYPETASLAKQSWLSQASGEAMYTSDIGVGTEQLYAATVASSRAHAHISKIDLSDAEKVLNSRSHPCVAGLVACSLRMT